MKDLRDKYSYSSMLGVVRKGLSDEPIRVDICPVTFAYLCTAMHDGANLSS